MASEHFIFPTSFAQQRLWFLDQMVPGNPFYNASKVVRFHFAINTLVLKKSLNEIVRRHEPLRTTFTSTNGQAMQVVSSVLELDLPIEDLTHLPVEEREARAVQLANKEASTPFDLSTGPLVRTSLLKLDYTDHVFILSMHHIICDQWSLNIFFEELTSIYEAFLQGKPSPLPELPIQYADFAVWQREYLSGEVLEEHLSYWKKQLADLPQLNLPTDRARPAFQSFQGKVQKVELSSSLSTKVRKFSQQRNVTLFMTFSAAFVALLHRYCQQEDIVMGVPIAGRHQTETEKLIGFFVNSLVLRVDVSGRPGFGELLQRVKKVSLEAYAHGEVPFEKLVEELHPERDPGRNPLFQVTFQFLQYKMATSSKADNGQAGLQGYDRGTAIFDLRLSFGETPEGIGGEIEYSTDLFDAGTISRMAGHITSLLEEGIADPEMPVSEIPILSANERTQLLEEWNNTGFDFQRPLLLHELFEAQVEKNSRKTAVVSETETLTYDQLNDQANQVARYLGSRGIRNESLVGICMDRSARMVVVLLGILKTGAAYIPLDPAYPKDRLQFIIKDSQLQCLVTENQFTEYFPGFEEHLLCLDTEWEQITKEHTSNLSLSVDPANIAYVIYTSGSTGIPKGASIPHTAICNHMLWMQQTFRFAPSDKIIQRTPYCFDASVWEFYAPLLAGAQLVMLRPEGHKDIDYLVETIKKESVSILQLVPSLLQVLLTQPDIETCTSLKKVFCGGEPLSASLIEKFYNFFDADLYNLYGPTEAAIDTTFWPCRMEKKQAYVPIGRPISNVHLYVLDNLLNPTPIGVPGELFIGGAALARGYLNRPAMTAEKFIADPFSTEPGRRLYRTGDMVRYRANGELEFIGRKDHQVKVRGFRIELGEVEIALKQHPSVKDVVVLPNKETSGSDKLVAYIVEDDAYNKTTYSDHEEEWDNDQVNHWKMVYDEKIYSKYLNETSATFNTIGWLSSYTDAPIPDTEMLEWRDHTVAQILDLDPHKVLEIGCGSGLILLPVAPHCEQYIGTDFSSSIIQYLEQHIQKHRDQLQRVSLINQTADNFDQFSEGSFDTVILNSVVQYFPSINYLKKVLEGAVNCLSPGGTIFIGDVRCLPLLEAFHTSVELFKASSSLPVDQLHQRVQRQMNLEGELIIDPQFFLAFSKEFPRVTHVELRLKKGRYNNELTMFRYDVVLHLDQQTSNEHVIPWIEWQKEGLSLEKFSRLLQQDDQAVFGVSGIPDQRVNNTLAALNAIKMRPEVKTVDDLNKHLQESEHSAIHPNDIWELDNKLGYKLYVGWWYSNAPGVFDILAIKNMEAHIPSVSRSFFRNRYPLKEWHQYASNPLQGMFTQKLLPELNTFIRARLPDYMIPSDFIILDHIPLTPNGKVDRQALPALDTKKFELTGTYVAPTKLSEQMLSKIWSEVLDIERIGIKDHFFNDLGGHSLLATQLISRVRDQFQVRVPLQMIFEAPTIEMFGALLEEILVKEMDAVQ